MVTTAPVFTFESLAHGFCPVKEEVKPLVLALVGEKRNVQIGSNQFSVPACIQDFNKTSVVHYIVDYKSKEEYENSVKQQYGIDTGLSLIVDVEPTGKWQYNDTRKQSVYTFSWVREIHVAKLVLDNPREHYLSREFQRALVNLPDEYTNRTKDQFRAFFAAWGTHLIYEEILGGSIQMTGSVKLGSLELREHEGLGLKVHNIFKLLLGEKAGENGNHFERNSALAEIRRIGIVDQKLEIDGGNPDPLVTIEGLTQEKLQDWAESVASNPQEIRSTFVLFPYFGFLDVGKRQTSLYKATVDYLARKQSLVEKFEQINIEIFGRKVTVYKWISGFLVVFVGGIGYGLYKRKLAIEAAKAAAQSYNGGFWQKAGNGLKAFGGLAAYTGITVYEYGVLAPVGGAVSLGKYVLGMK